MRPDQSLFSQHLQKADFQIGVDKGMWGVVDDPQRQAWPIVYMWVQAAHKEEKPDKFYFRFDLNSYPSTAPTSCPWDIEKNCRLNFADWPKGRKFVSSVFRHDWQNGDALYAPCDRRADLPGHSNWKIEHPHYYWQSRFYHSCLLKISSSVTKLQRLCRQLSCKSRVLSGTI